MEALIGRIRKSKKHAADELEKKADLAFLERMKKRKPIDPTKLITHEAPKRALAYSIVYCQGRGTATEETGSSGGCRILAFMDRVKAMSQPAVNWRGAAW